MRIRALDVQTAQVQGQYNRNIAASPMVASIMESSASTTTVSNSNITQSFPVAPAASVTPVVPIHQIYKIGDTGPAGGLIFYDKGNNSGGWRYLEAAPVEAEFQARWTIRGTKIENTQSTIGSGRQNTQLIVTTFSKTAGEWDTAAQKAANLVCNNFSDWFLPSRDELDQMYGNLKRRNVGDFRDDEYYSSTYRTGWPEAVGQNFKDGIIRSLFATVPYYVRPIRQVEGS